MNAVANRLPDAGALAARHRAPGVERALLRRASAPSGSDDFRRTLELGRRPEPGDARETRAAAELLVSQLFYQPLLAEARRAPLGGEIGNGGRGEEVFGEQLDVHLADAMARAQGGLVSMLESRLARLQPAGPESEELSAAQGLRGESNTTPEAGRADTARRARQETSA